ncbi:unnamed protein product [Medioppia subpectinata]|uniref:Protein kinase domain-containing protein n=1 Tax=Medioppia subpectinata TaxID=1979941 RepID=A0A7R9KW68_9ACAR|nr:unnamed protein product [Medioppia subpectinata]CAG2109824.1 unnamed protein product [Medioppia subpectinata]
MYIYMLSMKMAERICGVCGDRAVVLLRVILVDLSLGESLRELTNLNEPTLYGEDSDYMNRLTMDSVVDSTTNPWNEWNGTDAKQKLFAESVIQTPALIRGLIFNFNDLEINRFKELFSSVDVMRDPTLAIASETTDVMEAFRLLQMRCDVKCRRIIKMSTNISEFTNLCEEDKIALLKTGCPEIICLISVLNFNFDGEFWTVGIDDERATILRLDVFKYASRSIYEAHRRFMFAMKDEYNSDINIIDLLTAIILFNPNQPNLIRKELVKLQQQTYMYLLQRYLEIKHNSKSESETRFVRLMSCLQELYPLNKMHVQKINQLETPVPLLQEIYDIKPQNALSSMKKISSDTDMSSVWEVSKENVIPAKKKSTATMATKTTKNALKPKANPLSDREKRQKQYESALKTYKGSDPLSVHYEYIQWLGENQSTTAGAAAADHLKSLLEGCVEQFYSSANYRNDRRLLSVFLMFIDRVDSPLELFHFFHENGFARQMAHFYVQWSHHLESAKDWTKGVEVLRLGQKFKAEPMDAIDKALDQIDRRVAKAVTESSKAPPKRQPLSKVKTKSDDGVKKSATEGQKKANKAPIIYCDENEPKVAERVGAGGSGGAAKSTTRSAKHTNGKPQPSGRAADDSCDESPDALNMSFPGVAIKMRPRGPDSPPIARFEKADPMKKFYFNERKLYAGGEEFSFEEIRARKWYMKKKREEEVVRSAKLEEEVAALRLQVQQLLCSQQSSQQPTASGSAQPSVSVKQLALKSLTVEESHSSPPPHPPSSVDSSANKSVTISPDNASKAAFSLVRDLWNGTVGTTDLVDTHSKSIDDHKPKQKENFLIFADTTITSKTDDRNAKPRESLAYGVDYTIALPKSEESFFAKTSSSSTPMADRTKSVGLNANAIQSFHSNLNFVDGMTAKLSPIIETSREYNSKSSSSSSGTMSTTGGSALSRRQRALSGVVEPVDPFDAYLLTQLLHSLSEPIASRKGFFRVKRSLPKIKPKETLVKLGADTYLVERLVATGAYAHVYMAQIEDTGDSLDSDETAGSTGFSKFITQKWFALKVAKQANEWEFYICDELHKRLTRSKCCPDIELSVMSSNPSVMFKDGCVLVDEFAPNGTLIDVVNACKQQDKQFPKSLIAYFALELILIVQQIHKNLIIHADIKPDNLLVLNFPVREDINNVLKRTTSLKLIDFGRSIDLHLFPEGTVFNVSVKTKGSQCCEMLDSKPWTFQTDWFGVLDCIHVMLFGDYIKVRKNKVNNNWEIMEKFKRYHMSEVWTPLFTTLLNIPNCEQMPDLLPFVDQLNEYIKQNINQIVRDGNDLEVMCDSVNKKAKK